MMPRARVPSSVFFVKGYGMVHKDVVGEAALVIYFVINVTYQQSYVVFNDYTSSKYTHIVFEREKERMKIYAKNQTKNKNNDISKKIKRK